MSNSLSMPGNGSKYKNEEATPAGFISGFWHGLLMPLFFLVSLFDDNVSIYETNNNNKWYHFGFILGISFFSGNTFHFSFGNTVM